MVYTSSSDSFSNIEYNTEGVNLGLPGIKLPAIASSVHFKRFAMEGCTLQELGARPLVNIYVGEVPFVAVGRVGHAYCWGHKDLHSRYVEPYFQKKSHSPTIEDAISGFEDEEKFIIRIDIQKKAEWEKNDSEKPTGLTWREYYQRELLRYEKALFRTEVAVSKTGKKVVFETSSPEGREFAKILGQFHRVEKFEKQSYFDAKKFIQGKCIQKTTGGVFYYAPWGSRFKSADQIQEALKPDLLRNRQEFLEHMDGMLEILDKDKRSKTAGVREGSFLIINPSTGKQNHSQALQDKLYDQLNKIVKELHAIDESDWLEKGVPEALLKIGKFIKKLRSINHPSFQIDDIGDSLFTTILADTLREKRFDKLGDGFSTPYDPLDIGHIRVVDGKKVWIFSESATEEQKAIVNRILNNKDIVIDFLCMLKPKTELTAEFRPSRVVKEYGDQEDVSFILLAGKQGEPEYRIVIRRLSQNREYWENYLKDIQPAEGQEPSQKYLDLSAIGPVQLAKIVNVRDAYQVFLSNEVARIGCPNYQDIPTFKLASLKINQLDSDYQIRKFINGARLDLECRTRMSFEEILKYGTCLGPLIADNMFAQRPNFLLNELLIVEVDEQGHPKKVVNIGTSQSFSNSTGANDIREHIDRTNPVYSAHIAGWLAAIRYGKFGLEAEESEIRDVEIQFLDNLRETFIEKFTQTQARGEIRQDIMRQHFDSLERMLGRPIPKDLDLRNSFWITEEMFKESASAIIDNIIADAREMSFMYSNVIAGLERDDNEGNSLTDKREELIKSVCALMSNHASETELSQIINKEWLGGSVNYHHFDVDTRRNLLVIAEVSASIWKVQPESFDEVFYLAFKSENPESFAAAIKQAYGSFLIKKETAQAFYGAIRGIADKISQDTELELVLIDEAAEDTEAPLKAELPLRNYDISDRKRELLHKALTRMTFGMFPGIDNIDEISF